MTAGKFHQVSRAIAFASAALLLGACGPRDHVAGNEAAAVVQSGAIKSTGQSVAMRRLTEQQYRNSIADIFGTSVGVVGHFDPIVRVGGLVAVGASKADITPSEFQKIEKMAWAIAEQVVNADHRDLLIPCAPAAENAPDDACAAKFYSRVGRLLFRRPLSPDHVQTYVEAANATAKTLSSFYQGLASGLVEMLTAPNFLYVSDVAEADPANAGKMRLDSYSKATRLSFLLWNTAPDEQLLIAAERGDLHSERGLARQADRMLASARMEEGVGAFFSDMFAFDHFESVAKDSQIYPAFTATATKDAKEQTLRTIIDLLLYQKGDYRDLFVTRKTFINGSLGLLYRIPVADPSGKWTAYEFPEGDLRAGIVSQVSFLALHSHPGSSSPTLRGRAVRELLLCQKVPDPPANINFALFNDPNAPHTTKRERLAVHNSNPVCGGCHKLVDPIGLTLEQFDGAGQYRATENGAQIDTSGTLNGVNFNGAEGLARTMRNDPALTMCLVNRLYSYGLSRASTMREKPLLQDLEKQFAAGGYQLPNLLRLLATSPVFYAVPPDSNAPAKSVAEGAPSKREKS
jgi:hypothetical protein